MAVIFQPATLLKFHRALEKRKYRRLFGNSDHRRPGPKAATRELIMASVELKQLYPRCGCPRIAYIITLTFGIEINKDVVPYVPISHPFVERLIGTIRREYLDQVPCWNSLDLARKLREFKDC